MLQNQVQDDGKSCGEGLVNLDKKLIVIYLWLLSDFERFLKNTKKCLNTVFVLDFHHF